MIIPLSLIALAIGGAVPSTTSEGAAAVVRALHAQDETVALVGYRLATANVDLCGRKMVESGATIGMLGQYSPDYRSAAASVLLLTDRPTVATIVPDSPAARAGLRVGDVLVDADGTAFAAPAASSKASFAAVEAATGVLETAIGDGHVRLTVERDGARRTVEVDGVPSCRARFQVAGNTLDALATPTGWIQISPKMLDFADTPDALAAVLGHELAHEALGHQPVGGKLRRAQELQADRLMPYLMKRAGFDPDAAIKLWRRFKAKGLGGLFSGGSYPGWSERIRAVTAERDRIAGGATRPPDELLLKRD